MAALLTDIAFPPRGCCARSYVRARPGCSRKLS